MKDSCSETVDLIMEAVMTAKLISILSFEHLPIYEIMKPNT